MVQPAIKTINEKMRALRQRYLEHLVERTKRLQHMQMLCSVQDLNAEQVLELKMEAHKLAGTGATYGFAQVSQTGKQLELLLDNTAVERKNVLFALSALVDACTQALMDDTSATDLLSVGQAAPKLKSNRLPRLLIVEDDRNMRNLLVDLLNDDAQIFVAENSTQGMVLLKQHKPNLVLLDRALSNGESGLELLEAMQINPELKEIPVIMITSSDQPEEVVHALMAGAADYIIKPFDPADVADKIRNRLLRVNIHILIADDDISIREILTHKFQGCGCRVTCVEDGASAWEKLQTEHFSLAILDRMMPGFDGVTLLRKMKSVPGLANIPVVFLTARHYGRDVVEGFNTGAADYVTKPFNSDELLLRVMRLIQPQDFSGKLH